MDLSGVHAVSQLLSILPLTYPGLAPWGSGEKWRRNGKDLGWGLGEGQEGKEQGAGRESSYPKKVPSIHPKADSLGYNTWVFILLSCGFKICICVCARVCICTHTCTHTCMCGICVCCSGAVSVAEALEVWHPYLSLQLQLYGSSVFSRLQTQTVALSRTNRVI